MAENTKDMTLDDVMMLEGRELDAAVAERIRWVGEPWKYSPIDGMPFDRPFPPPVPEFHRSWDAAMQVREWGRDSSRWADFLDALQRVIDERPGWLPSDSIDYLMWFEPIDLCRAALLVSP